jgi:DNA polymerase III, beta subunit
MSLLVEMTKESLMNAVQHVIKAVEVNTPVPILAGINIQARAEGITFTASNMSMTIQYTIPRDGISVNIQRTGEVVAPSRYLYDVIRKLNTDWIVLELKEQLILAIMSDHSQIRLCGMDSAEFPSVNYGDQGSPKNGLQINNSVLKSMIKQVALMASTSETRPVLTGVSFTCDQHTLSLIATDGIRLASRTLHIENHANEKIHAIIPAKNLYEVSKMLNNDDETTEIEVSNNRIKFIANGLHMESALIEGTFPSINNVIPQSYLSEIWVDTACLLTAVECVTVLANDNLILTD